MSECSNFKTEYFPIFSIETESVCHLALTAVGQEHAAPGTVVYTCFPALARWMQKTCTKRVQAHSKFITTPSYGERLSQI